MFAGDITDEPAVGMMGSVGVGILGVAICSVLDTYCLAADTPSAILQAPDIVALGYSTKSARAATVGTTISSGAQLAIDFRRFLRRFLVAVNCVSSAFIARLAPRVSGECLFPTIGKLQLGIFRKGILLTPLRKVLESGLYGL